MIDWQDSIDTLLSAAIVMTFIIHTVYWISAIQEEAKSREQFLRTSLYRFVYTQVQACKTRPWHQSAQARRFPRIILTTNRSTFSAGLAWNTTRFENDSRKGTFACFKVSYPYPYAYVSRFQRLLPRGHAWQAACRSDFVLCSLRYGVHAVLHQCAVGTLVVFMFMLWHFWQVVLVHMHTSIFNNLTARQLLPLIDYEGCQWTEPQLVSWWPTMGWHYHSLFSAR